MNEARTAQHTPGPWMANVDFDELGTWPHVYVVHQAQHASKGEAEANARVIAAAPELLMCVAELLGACEADAMDDKSNVYRNAMINARAAIAKATKENT